MFAFCESGRLASSCSQNKVIRFIFRKQDYYLIQYRNNNTWYHLLHYRQIPSHPLTISLFIFCIISLSIFWFIIDRTHPGIYNSYFSLIQGHYICITWLNVAEIQLLSLVQVPLWVVPTQHENITVDCMVLYIKTILFSLNYDSFFPHIYYEIYISASCQKERSY